MKTSNNQYSKRNDKVEKWIKRFGIISILLSSLTFSLLFFASFNELAEASSSDRTYPPTKREIAKKVRKEKAKKGKENLIRREFAKRNYFKFVKKGEKYLSYNRFEDAQIEFGIAIKISPSNKAAYIGLTKTLIKKCAYLEKNCTDAEDYIVFLIKSKFISEEEAQTLRSEIQSQ